MKKVIFLISIIGILLVVNFAIAKDKPEGGPFQAIWEAIADSQEQIDNIVVQPGPPGPPGPEGPPGPPGEPGWDEERISSLEARVAELEEAIGILLVGVVQDNFNNYTDGSIVGQGNWSSYVNGGNFIVQGTTVSEGAKALYNNSSGDSVITKEGTPLSGGKQIFYIKTDNRSNWGTDAETQVRVTKGPWASGDPTWSFAAVTFEQDGDVGYSIGGGVREYFATYNDNEWIKLEIEWRSSDSKARYRINNEPWTNWDVFWNSEYFTEFDYVGLGFNLTSGSGGVYFDNIY